MTESVLGKLQSSEQLIRTASTLIRLDSDVRIESYCCESTQRRQLGCMCVCTQGSSPCTFTIPTALHLHLLSRLTPAVAVVQYYAGGDVPLHWLWSCSSRAPCFWPRSCVKVCKEAGVCNSSMVVQDSGMRQDEVYKNKLIAAAGCSGDLEFAFKTLEELRASPHLAVSADTASATIRACVACGRPTQAFTMYRQFINVRSSPPPMASQLQLKPSYACRSCAAGTLGTLKYVVDAIVWILSCCVSWY